MSFRADVYNVMIASPSDVAAERRAVREIIYEWNVRHADEQNKVLLPVGWETHATPDMSSSPQDAINRQILFPSDLLIGIFWTRIGTPTAEYASGAVEEIERHIAAGKPAMLYFSEKPISPSSLDKIQYDELINFKKSCQPRGLYKGFKSLSDFKKQFENNLALKMKDGYFKSNDYKTEDVKTNDILTLDEKELLRSACLDRNGVVHKVLMRAGTYIETNGKHIITEQTSREIARWKSVLHSLVDKNLLKAVGTKGEVFEVTAAGFSVAESI